MRIVESPRTSHGRPLVARRLRYESTPRQGGALLCLVGSGTHMQRPGSGASSHHTSLTHTRFAAFELYRAPPQLQRERMASRKPHKTSRGRAPEPRELLHHHVAHIASPPARPKSADTPALTARPRTPLLIEARMSDKRYNAGMPHRHARHSPPRFPAKTCPIHHPPFWPDTRDADERGALHPE